MAKIKWLTQVKKQCLNAFQKIYFWIKNLSRIFYVLFAMVFSFLKFFIIELKVLLEIQFKIRMGIYLVKDALSIGLSKVKHVQYQGHLCNLLSYAKFLCLLKINIMRRKFNALINWKVVNEQGFLLFIFCFY